jgi:hypothetical protein
MDCLDDQSPYARMIRGVKSALDPRGILAPGRYDSGARQL